MGLPYAYVIAEIGGNHGGSLEVAKQMVRIAALSGAAMVKFQKRDVEKSRHVWEKIQRTDAHAYGPNEYLHRKALEFSPEQHVELKKACVEAGVAYGCSAWDQASYDFLASLDLPWIKVPSAKNEEWPTWTLGPTPLHVSLGMLDEKAKERVLQNAHGRPWVTPYACTSKYPSEANETYLGEVALLRTQFPRVGFSGHHKGIALDIGAYLLGAEYIERHFTLDRTAKGTDHAASLEPDGLRKLCRDLDGIREAYKTKPAALPECERGPWTKFKGGGR